MLWARIFHISSLHFSANCLVILSLLWKLYEISIEIVYNLPLMILMCLPPFPQHSKITRFYLTIFWWVKSGAAPLKPSNLKSFWFVLPCHPPRVVHHLSLNQGALSEAQRDQKYHPGLSQPSFWWVKRGTAPLKPSNIKSFWFILPWHPPGVEHHPYVTPGGPS